MNNISKTKPSRSVSKPKPKSTTGISNLTKPKTGLKPKLTKPAQKSSEKKLKKKSKSVEPIHLTTNIDIINKLITNAQQISDEQEGLLYKFSEITKKVTSNDYEIERLLNKNENEDFSNFIEKYTNNLSDILLKLRNHTEEAENIKCKLFLNKRFKRRK
jgi:hypothetical protein